MQEWNMPATSECMAATSARPQVNHASGVGVQLLSGIRWFHLKLCWVRAGLGRVAALRHRASTPYRIHEDISSVSLLHLLEYF